ncbi:MAG: TetR/AcrR family transcriptional regulator [Oscillospiraceae bacterium]
MKMAPTMREQQKEERRQQILQAGLDLFVQKGFAATKITDIAKAANMSTGLMFHYFPSKQALYNALAQIGQQGAQMALPQEGSSPLAFFTGIAQGILQALSSSPFYAKIFLLMSQSLRGDAPEEAIEAAAQTNNIQMCVPLIQAGQAAGEIKQGDALSLSFAFWASMQGVAESSLLYPHIALPPATCFTDILRA